MLAPRLTSLSGSRLLAHGVPRPLRTPCLTLTRPATTASAPKALTDKEKRKQYSHTLLLPKTSFPLKHKDIVAAEKQYRLKTSDELYKAQAGRKDNKLFVFHDGPPYANGNLHMGHALNRVLKDIINRYQVIRGKRVHYVPGWDCHGLPIEQKALSAIGKSHTSLDPLQVRAEARKVALGAIDVQKTEMRALGIMADWDGEKGTYRTLDHDFKIRQLRLFKTMVERGHVTHRRRPTYYSPSSRTALAEAELKYKDGHKSRSVYVGFPIEKSDMSDKLREVYNASEINGAKLELAIWTTTPWSLPGNMGVAVHKEMEYVLVRTQGNRNLVLAVERLVEMEEILGPMKVMGSELAGTRYTHLFHPSQSTESRPPVFISRHVTSQAGTGLVHSAPAHGHEDYEAFGQAGILPEDLRCPIDDDGLFTAELSSWAEKDVASALIGQEVLGKGTDIMVDLLSSSKYLLAEQRIEHRYPYDWKSKKPIIVRATPQWFADVEGVKETAVKSLESVSFHPPQSRKRLEAFVTSRSEWCISRQRSWGVPIPTLFGAEGPVMDSETLDHILSVLDSKGFDYWWSGPVEDFIPPKLQGQTLKRGYDTLDVWFDSGSSWTMLEEREPGVPVADVYLEGSDQHRGWFQSSLLTKLISSSDGQAPYGTVITHGFVMDESGEKMSKSSGNGLSPMEVIHGQKNQPAHGADVLRLWAASVDYTNDVSIGPSSIAHATEVMRKLRNTLRFLLANTANDQPAPISDVCLSRADRYVLHELAQLEEVVQENYDQFTINKVINNITAFTSSTLSAFYFDIIKDTLYCDSPDSSSRQAIVAVLYYTLLRVVRMVAPIAPHLAEELYEHSNGSASSVFLDAWHPDSTWRDISLKEEFTNLLTVRSGVQRLVEDARTAKHINTPSQAQAHLNVEGVKGSWLADPTLATMLGVSSLHIDAKERSVDGTWSQSSRLEVGNGSITVTLSSSTSHQCPRCWQFTAESDSHVCERCDSVISKR